MHIRFLVFLERPSLPEQMKVVFHNTSTRKKRKAWLRWDLYLFAKGGVTRVVFDYAGDYGMYTEVSDSFLIALENGHYSRLEGRVVGGSGSGYMYQ